MPFFLIALQFQ